jgi:hypothetical protein
MYNYPLFTCLSVWQKQNRNHVLSIHTNKKQVPNVGCRSTKWHNTIAFILCMGQVTLKFQSPVLARVLCSDVYRLGGKLLPNALHLKSVLQLQIEVQILTNYITEFVILERCLEKDESAKHILCDCEGIAYLRFFHLGHYLMEPGDYQDTPVRKIPHFIWSVGLLKGWNREGWTIDHWKSQCKGRFRPTLYAFLHSFEFVMRRLVDSNKIT